MAKGTWRNPRQMRGRQQSAPIGGRQQITADGEGTVAAARAEAAAGEMKGETVLVATAVAGAGMTAVG